jgi:FkbM family methyltransferase
VFTAIFTLSQLLINGSESTIFEIHKPSGFLRHPWFIFGRLKNRIIYFLQRLLGFERYLYVFSIFKILTLKRDRNEGDFFTFLEQVRPGDCVLDIGANIGIMSYFLSKKVAAGRVIAFEPVVENIHTLRKIIHRFDLINVELVEKALGEKSGKMEMVMPEVGKARKQGLSHMVHDSISPVSTGKTYEVEMTTLDAYFENENCRPTALKIDVENYEYFVLLGGSKMIQKYRPIIYTELWENENRNKSMDLVSSWGYAIKVVHDNHLVDWNPKEHTQHNFIFWPKNQ